MTLPISTVEIEDNTGYAIGVEEFLMEVLRSSSVNIEIGQAVPFEYGLTQAGTLSVGDKVNRKVNRDQYRVCRDRGRSKLVEAAAITLHTVHTHPPPTIMYPPPQVAHHPHPSGPQQACCALNRHYPPKHPRTPVNLCTRSVRFPL